MVNSRIFTSASRRRSERGSAAVEFAILLPLLILLLFGIIEFSIAYNHEQGLHAAAREGARVASLPQTTQAAVIDRVKSSLQGVLNSTDIANATITVTPSGNQPCNGAPAGTHVVVTVSAPDDLAIPLYTKTLTLTGRGEFLCE
jgi:Flp pilus assembly protein TadG